MFQWGKERDQLHEMSQAVYPYFLVLHNYSQLLVTPKPFYFFTFCPLRGSREISLEELIVKNNLIIIGQHCQSTMGSSIKCLRKIFRKTNISYPLIRRRTFAYQRVRNVSFSENFVYVQNDLLRKNLREISVVKSDTCAAAGLKPDSLLKISEPAIR